MNLWGNVKIKQLADFFRMLGVSNPVCSIPAHKPVTRFRTRFYKQRFKSWRTRCKICTETWPNTTRSSTRSPWRRSWRELCTSTNRSQRSTPPRRPRGPCLRRWGWISLWRSLGFSCWLWAASQHAHVLPQACEETFQPVPSEQEIYEGISKHFLLAQTTMFFIIPSEAHAVLFFPNLSTAPWSSSAKAGKLLLDDNRTPDWTVHIVYSKSQGAPWPQVADIPIILEIAESRNQSLIQVGLLF